MALKSRMKRATGPLVGHPCAPRLRRSDRAFHAALTSNYTASGMTVADPQVARHVGARRQARFADGGLLSSTGFDQKSVLDPDAAARSRRMLQGGPALVADKREGRAR